MTWAWQVRDLYTSQCRCRCTAGLYVDMSDPQVAGAVAALKQAGVIAD